MRRYPHIAVLIKSENVRDENGDLIGDSIRKPIEGRFQVSPNSGGSVNYDAKFFTQTMNVEAFGLDDAEIEFKGKKFKIVQHFDYQTHTELWLI